MIISVLFNNPMRNKEIITLIVFIIMDNIINYLFNNKWVALVLLTQ